MEQGKYLPGSRWWGYFTVWIRLTVLWTCHLSFFTLQRLCFIAVLSPFVCPLVIKQIHYYSMSRRGGREEVILEYWPPTSPLLCLCVSSWLTTEWNSASGGWLSSKPSSSHPRAPCLITTSTLRARSLNPGPRWCPSLRWMQICHFRYDKLFQEIWQISSNNKFISLISLALIIILQRCKKEPKIKLQWTEFFKKCSAESEPFCILIKWYLIFKVKCNLITWPISILKVYIFLIS